MANKSPSFLQVTEPLQQVHHKPKSGTWTSHYIQYRTLRGGRGPLCSISAFHHCTDFYKLWASSMSRGSISGTQCWMRDWHTASHKRIRVSQSGWTENKVSPEKMNQAAICVAFFLQSTAGLHEFSGTDTQNLPYQNRIKSDSCKI